MARRETPPSLFSRATGRVRPALATVAFGLWSATRPPREETDGALVTLAELDAACALGALAGDAAVRLRIDGAIVRTTVGRARLWCALDRWLPLVAVNRTITTAVRADLLERVADREGVDAADQLAAALDRFGRAAAGALGWSIGADDLRASPEVARLVESLRAREHDEQVRFARGEITEGELYVRRFEVARLAEIAAENALLERSPDEPLGALLASDLATPDELRRTTGFVGIVETPFGESDALLLDSMASGVHGREWVATARASRTTSVARELQAERARALLEELLDAIGDVRVIELDCGSAESRELASAESVHRISATAGERAMGRTLAETFYSRDGGARLSSGRIVDAEARDVVDREVVRSVRVRSLLGCRTEGGVCGACYGWDPLSRRAIRLRRRVGVHAARAIAGLARELAAPIVFHICGRYSPFDLYGSRANHAGRARWEVDAVPLIADARRDDPLLDEDGARHVALGDGRVAIVDDEGTALERFIVRAGDVLHAADGAEVAIGARVVTQDSFGKLVVADIPADVSATVRFVDVREVHDEWTGARKDVGALFLEIPHADGTRATRRIDLEDAQVLVDDGARVRRGQRLAVQRTEDTRSNAMSGGLPALLTVLETHDAPRQETAVTALFDGTVSIPDERTIELRGDDGRAQRWQVERASDVRVADGQAVRAGDALTYGSRSHRALLKAWGPDRLALHVLDELVSIFHHSRIPIAEVHLELLVRAMRSGTRAGKRRR